MAVDELSVKYRIRDLSQLYGRGNGHFRRYYIIQPSIQIRASKRLIRAYVFLLLEASAVQWCRMKYTNVQLSAVECSAVHWSRMEPTTVQCSALVCSEVHWS